MTTHHDEIRAAATLALLRMGARGLETLLVQRATSMVFHGGAWVFPGGAVDEADQGGGSEEETARHTAVRETREESAVAVPPGSLVTLSHWTTPPGQPRRFATWFFLAAVGQVEVEVDGGETQAHRWITPAEAIEARARGELDLPPPTFATLWQLQPHPDVTSALRWAAGRPPEHYVPHPVRLSDGVCSLYEGDAGYETFSVDAHGARNRLWMQRSGWRFESDGMPASPPPEPGPNR